MAVLEDGGYEIEYRDPRYREHELAVHTDPSKIAKDLTQWLACRSYPGRPYIRND